VHIDSAGVVLDLNGGQIALSGRGKSTLMAILSGSLPPRVAKKRRWARIFGPCPSENASNSG
jgi:ABC-type lipoprotein export system ATPase subunit